MVRVKRRFAVVLLSVLTALFMCLGVVFTLPTKTAKAETLSAEGWSLAIEGDYEFRIQNGNTYWSTYTNGVTTASMLDYTEINGKTLSEINAEKPGTITVTLQPAGGTIGSFYRVSINEASGITRHDLGTVKIRAGWSHTDANATYTIDTDLYFAHKQTEASQGDTWRYIPKANVVDISDNLTMQDQGIIATNTRSILIKSGAGNKFWNSFTPNERGGSFLNTLYINGTSVRDWNKEAHAALDAGEITDITYGSGHGTISVNKGVYAPIFVWNSAYDANQDALGSYVQTWIPTGYISNVSSFKVAKGWAHLQDDGTLYYVEKDVEYVKSGSEFVKVSSTVDISDQFKLLVQDYTDSNGTMLYYLHTNNTQYWTQQYGSAGGYSINEKEWKGVADENLRGGAVQMSYIEFNGESLYDINVRDHGAYGATQNNIASGGRYAPILAFLTPQELGNSIKLQVPSAYPSGSGTAATNHQTITIKKGFYVVDTSTNIKYEVTKDIQWDYLDGAWGEHVEKIETNVTMAKLVTDGESFFAGIALDGSDYNDAPSTYPGAVKTALSFAQSANFLSHILINDVALSKPGEAFLNVWGNKGYFTFRPGNNNATKITILAGCQFPTYNALLTGAKEVYVTTEDVIFVKGADGTWAKGDGFVEAGEYNTSVSSVVYARDGKNNWMMFSLSEKDYPNAGVTFNVATTESKISILNLYDKIVVDGYSLRSLMATHGVPDEAPKINLWQANCFAIRIPGHAGTLDGAQKVTIKAGAQFPSYAYNEKGIEAYYVTTENVTFVNVGNGVWKQQYQITFMADGEVISESTYIPGETQPTIPEVPAKEGCSGRWESYTVGSQANLTVHAVYMTSKGVTSIAKVRSLVDGDNNRLNILTIEPNNSDYPASKEDFYNIGLDVSHLQKFNLLDYITVNGTTLRELGVSAMAINKFTRAGLGLNVALSDSMTVVIKEGCQIPSYEFWQNPNGEASCYTVDTTYTCTYDNTKAEDIAFTLSVPSGANVLPFEDAYILSDLHQIGYYKTEVYKDGYEELTHAGTEADYRFGYVGSESFTLSFDFKFTQEPNYYDVFQVNLGAEGHCGVLSHIGWRFFLKRGNDTDGITQNYCIQFFSQSWDKYVNSEKTGNDKAEDANIEAISLGSQALNANQTYRVTIGYKLLNAETGEVMVYASIDDQSVLRTYTLGGNFVAYGSHYNTLSMNVPSSTPVIVCDPDKKLEDPKFSITLDNGNSVEEVPFYKTRTPYVFPVLNPMECGKEDCVFIGWTTATDPASISTTNLYCPGSTLSMTKAETYYAVWLQFTMRNGAAVRAKEGKSGLRFTVDVGSELYKTLLDSGVILEIGTILAPTDYLKNVELTHELGTGKYISKATDKWQTENSTYTAAFTNISYDQYGRHFSARGYVKVQYYSSNTAYAYTTYIANDHSRSIYDVATAAVKDKYAGNAVVESYVNDVADIVIDGSLGVVKNANAMGDYNVSSSLSGRTLTITLDKAVKAVLVNGTRIIMGKETSVMIDGNRCLVSGYTLQTNGLQLVFTLGEGITIHRGYYVALLQQYLDSDAYTEEHKAFVDKIVNETIENIKESGDVAEWATAYENTIEALKDVKTAIDVALGEWETQLSAPILRKGLGYTVEWDPVEGAEYYTVSDDNDYRERIIVWADETLTYKAEVIGKHNVTVTAHSYRKGVKSSVASNQVATTEVKPVFTYKSMLDGLYKFDSDQMKTMGLNTDYYFNNCYQDTTQGEYFVYYNADTNSWSPYPTNRTDWTSPEHFPAHAQRLKDMGNNVILIAYDTNGAYSADETWASSRMRYIMDTAWSMGMKVLVCDEVFYDLSMSDGSAKGAESKAQVTNAINARDGFADYVTHPAFYGFSLDDEPYDGTKLNPMKYTIQALDEACAGLGVSDPFYLACLFQSSGSEEVYTGNTLQQYYKDWLAIPGVDNKYLYVDIYTQHAMDYPFYSLTNRYENSFDAVYGSSNLGGKYDFYQAITAHTQNDGTLSEQDLYMSLLYAAAHDVAGYSWFCYFPIAGELAGSMVGYDGNGYGNGIGNNASGSYYNAAKTAGYQFELIQGVLDGYDWKTRSVSGDLLTTTLSNGTNTATMYVNADEDKMSSSVTVTASGSQCYLVGYGVGTTDAPYEAVSGSVTLAPGQAVICIS